MRALLKYLSMAALPLLLFSCEKPEDPVKLPPRPSSAVLYQVTMGNDYPRQLYFNINGTVTADIDRTIWDLAFDAGEESVSVYMNGGKGVLIAATGDTSLKATVDLKKLLWRWDAANGNPDSLALSGWFNHATKQSHDSVYVIDRGGDKTAADNYFRFSIRSVDNDRYVIRIASMDGSVQKDFDIIKNHNKQQVYFSFANGGQYLDFEPDKSNWHFCFLRYRWIYYEYTPPLLYEVTGVYINRSNIKVAIDSTLAFYDITLNDCMGKSYSDKRDAVGYDWKFPVFSGSQVTYDTRDYINFFLKLPADAGTPDQYYKMRFIDFYDKQGNRGSPSFELMRLQ